MNFQWLCNHPLAFREVTSVLSYFANIYFRIEIGCKRLTVVAGITVNDIKVFHFRKIVLRRISSKHARNTRVKTTAKNCRQSGLFKTLAIGPLPRILKMRNILGLIVCRVKIVHTTFQTRIHNSKVLIWKGYINNQFGLVTAEQSHQVVNRIGIHPVGCHVWRADSLSHCITF